MVEVIAFLAYLVAGVLAGLLAGMVGIAGGVVTVPCLFLIFKFMGFPEGYLMHLAIGTSLAAMVFSALSSTWAQNKKGMVVWSLVREMLPGIIIGSIVGAILAHFLSGEVLKIIFASFAVLVGIYFFRGVKPHEGDHTLPSPLGINAIGFGIASISNILGIGGGIITVPVLMAYKMPDKNAIACSAATGLFISFLGALAYLYLGLSQPTLAEHPRFIVGYIYIPAFIVISIATFLAAPYGVVLSHKLPPMLTRRVFATALLGTGLVMVFL